MPSNKYQLYVWNEFNPDYTDGLAFAIARSEEEAKGMIAEEMGFTLRERAWGSLSIHPLNKPVAFAVSGGG